MKKLFQNVFLITLMIFTIATSASALSLNHWGFSPTGSGTPTITNIDEITIYGFSLINSTAGIGHDGFFTQYGAFEGTQFTNGTSIIYGTGIANNYDITLELVNAQGSFHVNASNINEVTFTSGILNVYIDNVFNFGSATTGAPMYGANDGLLIASFLIQTGSGTMDFYHFSYDDGEKGDGRTDITFIENPNAIGLVNGFRPGYWFDMAGVDLSTHPDVYALGLAFTDSNNQIVLPQYPQKPEFAETGLDPNPTENLTVFYVRSDGSLDIGIQPIPEPATMTLFGMGLLGLGYAGRRRMAA